MAIYWIDFMQSANGTGTYASPYAGSTLPSLSSGDEIRIKSVLKSTIFDATFGYATPGSYKMIFNVSKNGALSSSTHNYLFKHSSETSNATFNVNNLYYIVELDQFFMAQSSSMSSSIFNGISENYIILPMLPIPPSWCDGVDHICTVKLVSSTYRSKALTTSASYIGATSITPNITVTDGWIDATTRITNGTAITIFQSGYTSSGQQFYIQNLNSSIVNLSNTVICDKQYGSHYTNIYFNYLKDTDVTIGTFINTYQSTHCVSLNNHTDSVGTLNITINNLICKTNYSYNILYSVGSTNLNVNVDIKKLFCYQFQLGVGSTNTSKLNWKIGQCYIVVPTNSNGVYGYIYNDIACSNPYVTFYDTLYSSYIAVANGSKYCLFDGTQSVKPLKLFDTNFKTTGVTADGTSSNQNDFYRDGFYYPNIGKGSNGLYDTNLPSAQNNSSTVFTPFKFAVVNLQKDLQTVVNSQVEYNPIKSLIKGSNINDVATLYNSSNNILGMYGILLYFIDNNKYKYYLSKIQDSITTDNYLSAATNRCLMEESLTTFKTISPSYKLSIEAVSATSYKEFFHRWNIPVESGKNYIVKFYVSCENGLPSTYFKNYQFMLRYNYNVTATRAVTSASQGGWEEISFSFTSNYAQILSLDMFLSQPLSTAIVMYISDFSITEV